MKTDVVRIDPEDPSPDVLKRAADVIRSGGLVVFPTETVYGLGANALDPKACSRIYEVKGRPSDNPLIVHIDSFEMLKNVVKEIPESARPFLEAMWPGPLTAIMFKDPSIPDEVTAGLKTVAVRFPSHPVARLLISLSRVPIAAPSANISGRPSPTSPEHVLEDMLGRVDIIITAGDTPLGLESTIIDFTKDPPLLLRPGPVTPEQLDRIGRIEISEHAKGNAVVDGPSPSPGLKYRHYAPEKPLILVEDLEKMEEVVRRYENPTIVCVEERRDLYPTENTVVIGSLKNEFSIAKNLFKILREVDKMEGEVIIVEGLPEKGILFSVMNRLRKAASERVI